MGFDEEYIRALRAMTLEQKFKTANDLYWTARALKAAYLRQVHPEWTEDQVQKAVRNAFLYVGD